MDDIHDTMKKFMYPDMLVKDFENWAVVIRIKQVTIGSLVLIHKGKEQRFSDLSQESYTELKEAIDWIENRLKSLFSYDQINYLALMMYDKECHYHVIPRYSKPVERFEREFTDSGWPDLPNMGELQELSDEELEKLREEIKNG